MKSGQLLRFDRSPSERLDQPSVDDEICSGDGCEEDLLQHGVPVEVWIGEVPGQTRFLQVHDVFTAARRGADQNHPTDARGTFECHLLRHHS
jgi:hypothetical protein